MSARSVSVLRTHDDRSIPAAGLYLIDSAHTSVEFITRHMMITRVRGRLGEASGRIVVGGDPEDSFVEAVIDVAALSTGNDQRDQHLRSGDFFDVDRYPNIRFCSKAVRTLSGGIWEVDGELTVRDVVRPVTLQVDFEGADVSPAGDERIGFTAVAELDREDFGFTWNVPLETGGLLVGKSVRIEIAVEAIATVDAN